LHRANQTLYIGEINTTKIKKNYILLENRKSHKALKIYYSISWKSQKLDLFLPSLWRSWRGPNLPFSHGFRVLG